MADLNRYEKQEKEEKEEEKSETEKMASVLIEKDNQVRQALQLLQTWNIFSQIRTGL